jgi:hypothetical protein
MNGVSREDLPVCRLLEGYLYALVTTITGIANGMGTLTQYPEVWRGRVSLGCRWQVDVLLRPFMS